jgi:hypothetical protein
VVIDRCGGVSDNVGRAVLRRSIGMIGRAAVGGALPQTEKENELMGEARDQMVQRAQGAAREAADSVREVASAVQLRQQGFGTQPAALTGVSLV